MTDISSVTAPSTGRGPGRPRGTSYLWADEPLYDKMEALMVRREVPTLSAAAGVVLPEAYGYTHNASAERQASIKRRLCRGYRAHRSTDDIYCYYSPL